MKLRSVRESDALQTCIERRRSRIVNNRSRLQLKGDLKSYYISTEKRLLR